MNVGVALSATALFDYPTAAALAGHIHSQLTPPPPPPRTHSLV